MNNRLAIDSFLPAPGPLVDVRSPSEYAKAHWPGAVNLPLFDDEGRAEVGTLYKQQGRQQAIQRGLELVGPKLAAMGEQLQQIVHSGDCNDDFEARFKAIIDNFKATQTW